MTRQIHDQFGKELLTELVQPFGQVGVNQEIHAETYHADLSFVPSPTARADGFHKLGLLGRMITHSCLIEYFWKPPTVAEIRSCVLKLFSWHGQLQREAKQNKKRLSDSELPQLWIVTTTLPQTLFKKCSPTLSQIDWGDGVYMFGDLWKTAIVAIDKLPVTEETVWLRLLGKGTTQEPAVETVLTWVKTDPSLSNILEIIYKWCALLDTKPQLTQPEKELLMNLSSAYQEARQKAVQQGLQQGVQQGLQQGVQQGRLEERRLFVESLLKTRFGKVDRTLAKVIDPLVQLSPQEVADWLLHLSREELMAKFGKKRKA
jgi:hypothetical protein